MKTKLLIGFLFLNMFLSAQSPTIEKLKEVVEQRKSLSDSIVLSSINDLFNEFFYAGNKEEYIYYSNLLLEEAKKRNHVFYERVAQLNKAAMLLQKEREVGKSKIDSILQIVLKERDSILTAKCYIYLGFDRIMQNQQDTTRYFFDRALQLLNEKVSAESLEATQVLAYIIANQGKNKEALELAYQGLKQARELKNNIMTCKFLTRLSNYYYYFNQYDKASDVLIEAIQIAEKENYTNSDLRSNYIVLADLYWTKNGDLKNALFYTKKAYEQGQKSWYVSKVTTSQCYAYYNIMGDNPNLPFAKKLILESLDTCSNYNMKFKEAVGHFYLGMIYSRQDSFELAFPNLIKSIKLCEELNKQEYKKRVIAYLTEKMQKQNEQIPIWIDTMLNQDLPTLDSKIWFYRIKKGIAVQNKNFKNTVSYFEKLRELEREHFQKACEINVEEQLLACQLEDEKEKTAMQKALIQTTNFKNRILAITAILASLLLGLFYFLYRTKRQHNKTILEKNEQISNDFEKIQSLNEDLNSKNELLADKNKIQRSELVEYIALQSNRDLQLKSIREEIQKEIDRNPVNIADWQLVNNRIEKLIDGQDEWVHFKRKIESLYPDFFMDLLLKHSNLTEREQMHCAYVLLGMTVNQVAKTLFISPKSAESARYRLKKKIGLGPEESLPEYIKNIGMIEEII